MHFSTDLSYTHVSVQAVEITPLYVAQTAVREVQLFSLVVDGEAIRSDDIRANNDSDVSAR